MADPPDELHVETCRFCERHRPSELGVQVCSCDGFCGFSHMRCFVDHVRNTGRDHCSFCRQRWRVPSEVWEHFPRVHRTLGVVNRVREAGSWFLTAFYLFGLVILNAVAVKFVVWIATGSPVWRIGAYESRTWALNPLDMATGGALALAWLVLATVIVAIKHACVTRCARRPFYRIDDMIPLSLQREIADDDEDDDYSFEKAPLSADSQEEEEEEETDAIVHMDREERNVKLVRK